MAACQELGSEENGQLLFNGCQVSVWGDEEVLQVDGVDGYTTMWMNNANELYSQKWLINFRCTLPQQKEKWKIYSRTSISACFGLQQNGRLSHEFNFLVQVLPPAPFFPSTSTL